MIDHRADSEVTAVSDVSESRNTISPLRLGGVSIVRGTRWVLGGRVSSASVTGCPTVEIPHSDAVEVHLGDVLGHEDRGSCVAEGWHSAADALGMLDA